MNQTFCPVTLYKKTEIQAAKFAKTLAYLLVILIISSIMQAFGDTTIYLILDHYVREELSSPIFLVSFTVTCISHVLLYKYLIKYHPQVLN